MTTDSPTEQIEQQTAAYGLVSWSGILLGALLGIAITIALNILGGAVGSAFVDPAARTTPDASSMVIFTGIWLTLATLIGAFVGGYVGTAASGFSRGKTVLHGLAVWALMTLATVTVVGSALNAGAKATGSAAGSLVSGTASAVGQGASLAANTPLDGALTRVRNTLGLPNDVSDGVIAEISDIARRRLTSTSLPDSDRARLRDLIAQAANVTPEVAQQRIDSAEVQAAQAAQTLREGAETAADAVSAAAFWAFVTMLLSLVAAVIGAGYGDRDETMPDLFGFRSLVYSGPVARDAPMDDEYVPPYKNRNRRQS